jgi:hypothetical protein
LKNHFIGHNHFCSPQTAGPFWTKPVRTDFETFLFLCNKITFSASLNRFKPVQTGLNWFLNWTEPKPFLFSQIGIELVFKFCYGLVCYQVVRLLSGAVRFGCQFGAALLVFLNSHSF